MDKKNRVPSGNPPHHTLISFVTELYDLFYLIFCLFEILTETSPLFALSAAKDQRFVTNNSAWFR
jgi:hypothetical protein